MPPPPKPCLYGILSYTNGFARRFVVTDPSDALLRALEQLVQAHGGLLGQTSHFLTKSEDKL